MTIYLCMDAVLGFIANLWRRIASASVFLLLRCITFQKNPAKLKIMFTWWELRLMSEHNLLSALQKTGRRKWPKTRAPRASRAALSPGASAGHNSLAPALRR